MFHQKIKSFGFETTLGRVNDDRKEEQIGHQLVRKWCTRSADFLLRLAACLGSSFRVTCSRIQADTTCSVVIALPWHQNDSWCTHAPANPMQITNRPHHITDHIHFHMLSAKFLAVVWLQQTEKPVPVCLRWSFLPIMCVHCYHNLLRFLSSSCSFFFLALFVGFKLCHSWFLGFCPSVFLQASLQVPYRETGLASSLYLSLPTTSSSFFFSSHALFSSLNSRTWNLIWPHLFS